MKNLDVKVTCLCGNKVDEKMSLKEAIGLRILYAIPAYLDQSDLDRCADSILDLFGKIDHGAEVERSKPELKPLFHCMDCGVFTSNTEHICEKSKKEHRT